MASEESIITLNIISLHKHVRVSMYVLVKANLRIRAAPLLEAAPPKQSLAVAAEESPALSLPGNNLLSISSRHRDSKSEILILL